MAVRIASKVSRRTLIRGAAATAATAGGGIFMPYLSRAADRAALTHGVQSGGSTIMRRRAR